MNLLATETLQVDNLVEKVSNWDKYLSEFFPKAVNFGIRLVLAIICYIIAIKLIKLIRKLISKSLAKANAEAGVIQFVDSLVKAILYIIMVLVIASQFGIDTTSLIAVAGTAGVTVGLALQGSLSNLAGGVLILVLKPFRVGDYIVQGGNEGVVNEISLFCTTLLTVDNRKIVIPNGALANNSLVNVSAQSERQIDIDVNVSYKTDLKQAKDLLSGLLDKSEYVMHDKGTTVAVTELGANAVVIKVRFWVSSANYWAAKWGLTEDIKNLMDENGISIPYSQLDVHLDK